MKSFNGQAKGIEVARYRYIGSRMELICKVYGDTYLITFYNGRQSSRTRFTEDKDEANAYIMEEIKTGKGRRIS